MTLLPAPLAVAAPCLETWSAEDLRFTLDQAELAFQERDKEGALAGAREAERELLCLHEPVDVPLAAKYHRVQGLAAFLERDTDDAALWFTSARAVEPDFVLPTSLVPSGHPVRALYDEAPVGGSREALPAPAEGRIVVDGRAVLSRSPDRPSIVQQVDGQGAVMWTAIVPAGAPVPPYPTNQDGKAATPPPVALHLVVGAGVAKGAVDRSYIAWAQLDEGGSLTGATTWDGWVSGSGPLLTVGGYARFGGLVDLGAEVQLIGSARTVQAGWEQTVEGQTTEDTNSLTFDPRPLPWLIAEPRMRMHVQQQQAASAYFLLGLPIGYSPGFAVESDIPYPRAQGRATLGFSFGGGVAWQVNERLGFYAELPYQFDLLGKTPSEHLGAEVDARPTTPSTSQMQYKPSFGFVFPL